MKSKKRLRKQIHSVKSARTYQPTESGELTERIEITLNENGEGCKMLVSITESGDQRTLTRFYGFAGCVFSIQVIAHIDNSALVLHEILKYIIAFADRQNVTLVNFHVMPSDLLNHSKYHFTQQRLFYQIYHKSF